MNRHCIPPWTLSFTAPTSEEAQTVLSGYIDYISALVVKESIENVRNKLEIKTQFEKRKTGSGPH